MQPVCEDFFHEIDPARVSSGLALNPPVRGYLDAVRSYLLELHDAGEPASAINAEHAELCDRLVRRLFRTAEDIYFERYPRLQYRMALIAVGGYGRGELSLASDLDLLFLHPGKVNAYVETVAETLTQRLWDARRVVGAATRTLGECERIGRDDVCTLTSFLDARFLIGAPELFAEFEEAVREWIRADPQKFVEAKLAEQEERHQRFGESLYLLQPNLREGVGGLRDYHTALWVARAINWNVRSVRTLHVHGFIDEVQAAALAEALEFLWRVRNELHRKGRKDDRMHYGIQEDLATCLGLEPELELTPIHRLMQAYYLQARRVERVSRHVVQHVLLTLERRKGRQRAPARAVAEGFVIADHLLEIPSEQTLRERPLRLLAAVAVAQHHDVDISPRSQRLLRLNRDLVDEALRVDREAADLFLRILRSPLRVYRSLKLLAETGLLGEYLPEFRHLVGLWQQDMYHTYTVDVHSLFLVEQLRRLKSGRFREELPLATALMREVTDPEILFLGCVLHDIGKGKGGGHSERGAQEVPDICERLALGEKDTEMVQMLVRHHLTMSAMAEQRNVDDPRVILRLADIAGSREGLRNLYLVTVADIRSVSAEAWNSWKGGLLERLYRNASDWFGAFDSGAQADQFFLKRAAEQVEARQKEVLSLLGEDPATVSRAGELLDSMPRRYLLDHATVDIVTQLRAALAFVESRGVAAVATYSSGCGGAPFWGVLVLAPDRRALFSTVTGAISSLGHDILGAQVYTSRSSLAFEIYQLEPIPGGAPEEELERQRVEERVVAVLSGDAPPEVRRPAGVQPPARRVPPRVHVSNEESDLHTVIDVHANDRPGLLYDVTRALVEFDLDVMTARVATRAHRVTDAFYVTREGKKLSDADAPAIAAKLLRAARGSAA